MKLEQLCKKYQKSGISGFIENNYFRSMEKSDCNEVKHKNTNPIINNSVSF